MATAVVVGTVIGSGVFVKGRTVTENVPQVGLAMAAWVLGGILALLGALALAEVAVLFPRAGGNYVFLREGYGRWAGFLWGWVEFWIIRTGSIAALASVFAEAFHDILRYVVNADGWSAREFARSCRLTLPLVPPPCCSANRRRVRGRNAAARRRAGRP